MKTLITMALCLVAPALALADNTKAQGPMTDGNIVAVVTASHQAEIELAKLALEKSTRVEIKTFATQMTTDHGAALAKLQALGLAAEETEASKKLTADSVLTANRLRALSGAEFDKAYVDAMVTDHKAVLDGLDKMLIPGAKKAELKKHLKDIRPTVAKHLAHAEAMQKTLLAPAMN